MGTLEEMIDIARSADRVYLPNRYNRVFKDGYTDLTGRAVPTPGDRQLVAVENGVTFRFVRGRDVPRMVAEAAARYPNRLIAGFSGSDWCLEDAENNGERVLWASIGVEMGRVSLIATEAADSEALMTRYSDSALEGLEVATAYPNLVRGLARDGANIKLGIALNGCVESAADELGMEGFDMVSTGETLRQNGWKEVYPIYESLAALVVPAVGQVN
jgi:ATP phosphoribosyltransferase